MKNHPEHAPEPPRLTSVCSLFGLAFIAALFGLLAYGGISLTFETGRVAAFWIGNALVIGLLLGRSRRCMASALALCLVANVAANLAVGDTAGVALGLSLANFMEMLLALSILSWLGVSPAAFDRMGDYVKLIVTGACATLAPALLAASVLALTGIEGFGTSFAQWTMAHFLPLPIVVSTALVLRGASKHSDLRSRHSVGDWAMVMLATCIAVPVIFAQTTFPFLFLAAPVVILAAFKTGRVGTALVVAIFACSAAVATFLGSGPIALVPSVREEVIALQVFFASCLAIGLPVAIMLSHRSAISRELEEGRDFIGAILDGIGDLVFRVDADWKFTYLNRRWEELTGFATDSLLGETPFDRLLDPGMIDLRDEKRAIEGGYPVERKHIVDTATADGRVLQIEIRLEAQFDEAGNFAGAIGTGTDVSERIARAHALAESEARFRKLAEASPVGIFQADAAGKITYVNRVWLDRFGLSEQEMLGDGWKAALASGDEYEDDPAFAGFRKPGDVRRRTIRFRDVAGEEFWCETVTSAEFDERGTICGYVGAVHDITEQLRATEALRASEKRLQTLSNMAPAGIFRTTADGACTYVNESWKEQTGIADGEWEGFGWTKAVHPDDWKRVKRSLEASAQQGVQSDAEFRWLRPDGTIVWVHGVYGPEYDDAGAISGFIGVASDITDRKHALDRLADREEQLALLADNATDTVLRLALDGTCNYASPSAAQLFGIDHRLLVGNQFITGFHEDDSARVQAEFDALAAGSFDSVRITFRSLDLAGNGNFQWLEANCGLVRDPESGAPVEIIASLRNVDETKRLEAALLEAKERAEAAVTAKSAFLANMSHEIRTPMNGVIGFTELALAGELPDDQRQNLEMIADSGRAMLRLLNDLLDFAKIEAGQMVIASEPTDLRHKLKGAMRIMEPVAAQKGLALNLQVANDVPQCVLADPLRLRQIILNLVGNALKFTESGSVSVDVRLAGAGSVLEIAVSDTGIGIASDQIEAVFEKFTQADSTIARRFGGTGLGLPICAQLAELMGGAIRATSVEGEGSTFLLALPLREGDAGVSVATPALPVDTALGSAGSLKVLVAEDNYINQQLTLAMLETVDCTVTLAEDGRQAIDAIRERHGTPDAFDIVLMDMQMPNLDGLQATRKIRSAGLSPEVLPIVALTANAYAEDIEACREAGMQAHIAKPLRLRELQNALATWARPAAGDAAAFESEEQSEDPALRLLYDQRKRDALAIVDAAIRQGALEDASLQRLVSELHQIAGIAAFFGEEALGVESRRLEKGLLAQGASGMDLVTAARDLLAA